MTPKQSWILDDTNPLLHKVCDELILPVNTEDQLLIDQMCSYIDACYEQQDQKYNIRGGIALAGPQVGLMKKVIYVHFKESEKEYQYLIANPKIIGESMVYAYLQDGEGCLSVNGEHDGIVKRRNRIIIVAYDLIHKQNTTIDAQGYLAICLQHEMDHLNGILYYDRINTQTPNYTEADWIKY